MGSITANFVEIRQVWNEYLDFLTNAFATHNECVSLSESLRYRLRNSERGSEVDERFDQDAKRYDEMRAAQDTTYSIERYDQIKKRIQVTIIPSGIPVDSFTQIDDAIEELIERLLGYRESAHNAAELARRLHGELDIVTLQNLLRKLNSLKLTYVDPFVILGQTQASECAPYHSKSKRGTGSRKGVGGRSPDLEKRTVHLNVANARVTLDTAANSHFYNGRQGQLRQDLGSV